MINRLAVANFQSLRRVDLELGTFTVIVGPSSSGKSALMRAFRALASNVRGSGFITRGQKNMAITAQTDTHTITLERSERSGTYRVTGGEGGNLTFTKLAGDVPDQVTAALRIDPIGSAGSVNFANQFDKPYLLDESGSVVAWQLGELTNVTKIFDAVRAANRIRTQAASTLRTRLDDLEQVKTRLAAFQGLQGRLAALEQADKLDAERRELEARMGRLDAARRTLLIAERAIARTELPDVPDAGPLDAALNRYLDLAAKLRGVAAKQARLADIDFDVEKESAHVDHHQNKLTELLAKAGTCPTCGQATSRL